MDIWLKEPDTGGVIDWASVLIDVEPETVIEEIALVGKSFMAGQEVAGAVKLSKIPSDENSRLRIELIDGLVEKMCGIPWTFSEVLLF